MEIVDISPENFVYDYNKLEADENHFDYYKKYYNLHTEFLRPLNIKIDINLFEKEIKRFYLKLLYLQVHMKNDYVYMYICIYMYIIILFCSFKYILFHLLLITLQMTHQFLPTNIAADHHFFS